MRKTLKLQDLATAELLQERVDSLESAISEIESINFEYEEEEEEEIKQAIAEELGLDIDFDDCQDNIESLVDEKRQELESEWVQEKLEDLQAISFE